MRDFRRDRGKEERKKELLTWKSYLSVESKIFFLTDVCLDGSNISLNKNIYIFLSLPKSSTSNIGPSLINNLPGWTNVGFYWNEQNISI